MTDVFSWLVHDINKTKVGVGNYKTVSHSKIIYFLLVSNTNFPLAFAMYTKKNLAKRENGPAKVVTDIRKMVQSLCPKNGRSGNASVT